MNLAYLLCFALLATGCSETLSPTPLDFVFKADVDENRTFGYAGVPVTITVTDTDVRVVDGNFDVRLRLPIVEAVDFSPHGDVDRAICLDLDTTTSPPFGRQAVLLAPEADDSGITHDGGMVGLPKRQVTVCNSPL